jgi:3-dehydroquinate dehydratase-2
MHICIMNGPNLNLLGKREVEIYGDQQFETYMAVLKKQYPTLKLSYFQSNVEGELINHIQSLMENCQGLVLNAASYTHTSVGISDALAAVQIPTIEVHISNIYARETFRQQSLTAKNCIGVITGLGLSGYDLAIQYLLKNTL